MFKNWVVVPTCPPIVLRRCPKCASGRCRANGRLRVNANHGPLDARHLVICAGCRESTRLTVLERTKVRSVQPELLNLLHDNDTDTDTGLAAELLPEPVVRRHEVGGSGRTERPAWQSPYGPPPHRSRRGRWAPVPGLVTPRSVVRHGYLGGQCD